MEKRHSLMQRLWLRCRNNNTAATANDTSLVAVLACTATGISKAQISDKTIRISRRPHH
jgi:hypothetical protein